MEEKQNTRSRHRIEFESMRLQVGTRLQVLTVLDIKPVQTFSTLIGYVKNDYLILKTPFGDKGSVTFREGGKLSIRVFSGVSVCTFDVTIQRIFGAPLHYIHVSFPDTILASNLRTAMRVQMNLPATVSTSGSNALSDTPAILRNLSVSGALIESVTELGNEGTTLSISFDTQGMVEVDGLDTAITAQAIIRNSSMRQEDESGDSSRFYCGVEFLDLDPTHQLIFHTLTYQAVIEDRQKIV
ncbi:flagellar brake domain-containing protein [Noviherbaspirillum sp. Root189]|uniref:flagellar brake domain-containing protein n=1 Tax=Noviherbaspirillum sp. Root189 TaxID=1736487 RepID=UPI0009E6DEB0|nr:flagellar brake protein [Noviherbaspirillum sp. Root189]